MFLYIYKRDSKEYATVPASKVPLFREEKYLITNKYFVKENGTDILCNILSFARTKKLLNEMIDKARRLRVPAAKTLQSLSENSAEDEPARKTAAILEIKRENYDKVEKNLEKRLLALKKRRGATRTSTDFDEDKSQATPPKKSKNDSYSEVHTAANAGFNLIHADSQEASDEEQNTDPTSEFLEKNYLDFKTANLLTPHQRKKIEVELSRPQPTIISHHKLVQPLVFKDKFCTKAPLKNITNESIPCGIEASTNKQNLIGKAKANENANFQRQTLSTRAEVPTGLENDNNNTQSKSAIRGEAISEARNYESNAVKSRALKYAQSVRIFKNEICNLRKQVQKISEECETLRNLISQKDTELYRIRQLNENLQKCCINSADEMKTLLKQNNKRPERQMLHNGYLPAGYMKKDDSQIHLGRDVWISKDCYYLAVSNIRSNSVFVRNLAIAVFGEETLIRSTLSGRGSNRNRQTKNPECGKLDERKCLAIKDFYRYWLMTERNMDDIQADIEAQNTFDYIRKKISDMKTFPRGSVGKKIDSQENETEDGNPMSDEENESTLPEDVLDLAHALRNGNEEMENLREDGEVEENEEGGNEAEENETANEFSIMEHEWKRTEIRQLLFSKMIVFSQRGKAFLIVKTF